MTSRLPWTSCDNWWNTEACIDGEEQRGEGREMDGWGRNGEREKYCKTEERVGKGEGEGGEERERERGRIEMGERAGEEGSGREEARGIK